MKRFLYSRLQERHKGYSLYIPPSEDIGLLYKAITNDMIGDKRKLLFLQNREGKITFGVREQLIKRDSAGRPLCNFMGYQLEENEDPDCIPFFNEISRKFGAITEEANRCHDLLNRNPECGKNLRQMEIQFDKGNYQKGNAWDRTIIRICQKPSESLLMMFDECGNALNLAIYLPQTEKYPNQSARHSKKISSVNLTENERTIVPPLGVMAQIKKPDVHPDNNLQNSDSTPLERISKTTLTEDEKTIIPPLEIRQQNEESSRLQQMWKNANVFLDRYKFWKTSDKQSNPSKNQPPEP